MVARVGGCTVPAFRSFRRVPPLLQQRNYATGAGPVAERSCTVADGIEGRQTKHGLRCEGGAGTSTLHLLEMLCGAIGKAVRFGDCSCQARSTVWPFALNLLIDNKFETKYEDQYIRSHKVLEARQPCQAEPSGLLPWREPAGGFCMGAWRLLAVPYDSRPATRNGAVHRAVEPGCCIHSQSVQRQSDY